MCCPLIDCAKCCTIFSFVGMCFLIVISILLSYQPEYMKVDLSILHFFISSLTP